MTFNSFQIGMSYWLYDGFQLDNETEEAILGPQFAYYNPLLGVSEEGYTVDFDDTDGILSKFLNHNHTKVCIF